MVKSMFKQKLPQQYSYVLQSEQLSTLLIENEMTIPVFIYYFFNLRNSKIFEAIYNDPYLAGPQDYDHFQITVGAVHKDNASTVRTQVTKIVIPEFITWAKWMSSLTRDSTQYWGRKCRNFYVEYTDGVVTTKHTKPIG